MEPALLLIDDVVLVDIVSARLKGVDSKRTDSLSSMLDCGQDCIYCVRRTFFACALGSVTVGDDTVVLGFVNRGCTVLERCMRLAPKGALARGGLSGGT